MKKRCKHCGIRYSPAKGQGEFCCAGCEHVYGLILEGGLGGFYLQQDRAGRPVGDRPFSDIDTVLINQLQEQAESGLECKIVIGVQGMSCMGCAWLIEQLAKRQPGVHFAKVALNSNCLSLAWKPGDFELTELANELRKFGYRINGDLQSGGHAVSPLAMRFGLTLIFSLNGLLLLAASAAGLGGAGFERFYDLLIVVCLFFSQLIGGDIFLRPAWRGFMIRRFQKDALPAIFLTLLFLLALASQLLAGAWDISALIYFLLLPVMVLTRWQSEARALKMPEG